MVFMLRQLLLVLKILGYFEENKRNLDRLKRAINQIQTIQMSGPIGTYSNIDQRVEKIVAKKDKVFN